MLDEIETTPQGEDNQAFRSDYGQNLAKARTGTETSPNDHGQGRIRGCIGERASCRETDHWEAASQPVYTGLAV